METTLISVAIVPSLIVLVAILTIRFLINRKRKPRGFSRETEVNIDRLMREREEKN